MSRCSDKFQLKFTKLVQGAHSHICPQLSRTCERLQCRRIVQFFLPFSSTSFTTQSVSRSPVADVQICCGFWCLTLIGRDSARARERAEGSFSLARVTAKPKSGCTCLALLKSSSRKYAADPNAFFDARLHARLACIF